MGEHTYITKSKRIRELKAKLKETDYKAIKFGEGEIPLSEYNTIREQRRRWREEINTLETELKSMSGGKW